MSSYQLLYKYLWFLCFRHMPSYLNNYVFFINYATKAAYFPLWTLMYYCFFVTIRMDYGRDAQSITLISWTEILLLHTIYIILYKLKLNISINAHCKIPSNQLLYKHLWFSCLRPMPTYFVNFVFFIYATKAAYCPLWTLMYILHFL